MRPMKAHLILDISYSADRLTCVCGKVMHAENGSDWTLHRSETGLTDARNAAKSRWKVRQGIALR